MRTVEVKLYQFEELSDAAKEKAKNWYRDTIDYEWWDCIYDEFFEKEKERGIIDLKNIYFSLYPSNVDLEYTWIGNENNLEESDYINELCNQIGSALENELDWLYSDECVSEHIIDNQYEFTEDGKRA